MTRREYFRKRGFRKLIVVTVACRKTSPLCLLSFANYIASASYLLAECMMYDVPLLQAFDKIDQRWVEAFGGKELRLSGDEGVDKFKRSLAGE